VGRYYNLTEKSGEGVIKWFLLGGPYGKGDYVGFLVSIESAGPLGALSVAFFFSHFLALAVDSGVVGLDEMPRIKRTLRLW
jgi:hypothetical protein